MKIGIRSLFTTIRNGLVTIAVISFLILLSAASTSKATLASYWTFDTQSLTSGGTGAGVSATLTAPTQPTTWDTGTTIGDPRPGTVAGTAFAGNSIRVSSGSSFQVQITSSSGLTGFTITYVANKTGGSPTQGWEYSLNGTTWTTLSGGPTTIGTSGWNSYTADFSSVTALNTASTVYFRDTVSGGGTVDFDNIVVNFGTVTPVPEPTGYAMAAFGLICIGGGAGRYYFRRKGRTGEAA